MRRITYLWQRDAWPAFSWDAAVLLEPLVAARHQQGRLLGRMDQLGFDVQGLARVQTATEEAVKSSAIEGEVLDRDAVRSSVARRLGIKLAGLSHPVDQRTEGVVEMTLDATVRFDQPLTERRLFGWHAALFPGARNLTVGGFRDDRLGPMQVVSGPIGKERVHFEAPPAPRLPAELKRFLAWFAAPPDGDGLIRAGLAHLWLVTLHPFDDGNGRITRAVTDQALAQLEGRPQRYYSLSSQLRAERAAYYDALEQAQRGPLDVTAWLQWFIGCFARALGSADGVLGDALARAELGRRLTRESLNERQRGVMGKLLAGLEGKLTARRWAALTKCSADSAQRDIRELVELKLLKKNEGGSKNTSYALRC